MKVNIDQTVEVSDEQRKLIAETIDGEGAKKREATRDEMKAFIWQHGEHWADRFFSADQLEPDEDLIGDTSGLTAEDLI